MRLIVFLGFLVFSTRYAVTEIPSTVKLMMGPTELAQADFRDLTAEARAVIVPASYSKRTRPLDVVA